MPKPPAAFSPLIDDEIELPVARSGPAGARDDGPPAAADNIADEKNAHAQLGLGRSITSRSVSTRSSRASRGRSPGTSSNFLRGEGDADRHRSASRVAAA